MLSPSIVRSITQSKSELPVHVAPSIREIHTEDGAALLDIHQGKCFSMNPVGARIWTLLKLRYPIDKIAGSVATEFGAAREEVQKDVIEFVHNLAQNGLLASERCRSHKERRRWLPGFLRGLT